MDVERPVVSSFNEAGKEGAVTVRVKMLTAQRPVLLLVR